MTHSSRNSAYILVKCEPGLEEEVLNSLKKTKGIVEVDQVYGSPYDMVVKITCDSLEELDSTVWRTRRANGIRLTQTLIVGNFV